MPIQYGTGSEADRFWESLAHKTYSHRLPVAQPNELKIVFTAAIHYAEGGECIQVKLSPQQYISTNSDSIIF